ncbi:MAG: hypothetical protein Q9227_002235 [Pyrenula ochraceoflavens]
MYKFHADGKFSPYPAYFTQAMQDPGSFHAILGLSAAHMASLIQQRLSLEAIHHTLRAIQLLDRRLSDISTSASDGNLLTILLLTGIEDRFGSYTSALTHVSGARRLITLRGGFRAFSSTPVLQAHLCWTDLIHLASHPGGASIFEPFFLSLRNSSSLSSSPFSSSIFENDKQEENEQREKEHKTLRRNYYSSTLEELELSVRNFEALALHRRQNFPSDDLPTTINNPIPSPHTPAPPTEESTISTLLTHLTSPTSPLHTLLLSPAQSPSHTIRPGFSSPHLVTLHARVVVLLYIHAALWEYRFSPSSTISYLSWLNEELDGGGCGSVVVLLWVIMTGGRKGVENGGAGGRGMAGVENVGRTEWVLRMMGVVRRMEAVEEGGVMGGEWEGIDGLKGRLEGALFGGEEEEEESGEGNGRGLTG